MTFGPTSTPSRPRRACTRASGAARSSLLLAVLFAAAACRSPQVGLAASVLPNVGLELTGAGALASGESADLAWEANLAHQFFDDELFASDGRSSAKGWTQAGLSLRATGPRAERTRWVATVGPQWIDAGRKPNIVDEPGRYVGLRIALGFETELVPGWVFGPNIALMPVYGGRRHEVRLVPQLVWGLRWSP
jgi:hypothetical protein